MYIIIALYASKFNAFQAWKSFELLKSFFFQVMPKDKELDKQNYTHAEMFSRIYINLLVFVKYLFK